MTHTYIEEQEIIDRYLLGTLPAQARAEFEEHFLGCADCLRKLEASRGAVALIAAACTEDRSAGGPGAASAWRWFSSPAWGMAALVILAVWVAGERAPEPPAARSPVAAEAPSAPMIDLSTFRDGCGPAVSLHAADAARAFGLRLDLLGLEPYTTYSVEIVNDRGALVWSAGSLTRASETTLEVSVQAAPLRAGTYWVRLSVPGAAGAVLLREYALVVAP